MAVLISYQHQLLFYNTILEKMEAEDTGPLAILTSDGRVTLSGKVMQIFSPLVRSITAALSACWIGQEPLFVSLPEFNSATVSQLMELLLRGKIMEIGTDYIENVQRNVIDLASSLGIMIKIDQTLVDDSRDDEMNDISCRGSLRVRNIEEMVILSGDQRHYEKDRNYLMWKVNE